MSIHKTDFTSECHICNKDKLTSKLEKNGIKMKLQDIISVLIHDTDVNEQRQ